MADVITMPKLGFDMAEGTLLTWVKKEGDPIEKGELLAEIETDKATVEVESMFTGTVRKHLVSEGAIVPINAPIAVVGGADEEIDFDAIAVFAEDGKESPSVELDPVAAAPASTPIPSAASTATPTTNLSGLPGGVMASPLARKMAVDNGIDLNTLAGSGPGGRIVKKDIEVYLASPPPAADQTLSGPVLPSLGAAQIGPPPSDVTVPLSRLRQAIGRRMVQSKQDFPSFYVTHEFDLDALMGMRKQANEALAANGEKLSVNDFIVKGTALALREFPNLNAALQGDAVVQFGRVNVGVAVAVPNGLLIVVCHDADRKSMRQISIEIKEKAGRVRKGKIHPDDVTGSTFSISNLGMFDVDDFTAIINPPEAAILAIGSGKQVPVVADGEVKVGWRMKATVTIDHRVSDGAEGAQFMQALARYLEKPVSMML